VKSRLVLFDIDGTLLLTAGAGRRAIVRALAPEVEDASAFSEVRFDGKTDPQIVGELLQAAGHADAGNHDFVRALCVRYVAHLEAELMEPRSRTHLLPGVPELLEGLEAVPGVLLGLLTGNVSGGAALKLRAAGLDPARFVVGAYGSDSAHRPDLAGIAAARAEGFFGRAPSGPEVVIVGDTPADMTCGLAISARALGTATGSYSVPDLVAAGAHRAFVDLSDTVAVLGAVLE
jgi:phosphoglycolate phosphatase